MNLKSTCIYVTAALAIGAAIAAPSASALADEISANALTGGGQAPPGAAGGSGGFGLRIAGNLPQSTAEALKTELVNEGYTGAVARPAGNGAYEVMLTGLASRSQAEALMGDLRSSGYTPDSIVGGSGGGTGSAATATAQADSVFRVLVAEFDSAEQANEASRVLVDDGFVNVDVVEEEGKHKLMLGTFNRREDAEALLSDVNRAGFALASVVDRERLQGSDTGSAAATDLSGLSANEQQRTRDILAMAEKAERGEASADELKQLREMVQQLSANQKAILGQQESNRSADHEKLQRIFQLYRDFDQAMEVGDYTAAEQALAEVRQVDPENMFLANRLQVLQQARSGGAAPAAAAAGSSAADPAQVQALINEARRLESSGSTAEAAAKYREVQSLDPTNVEARTKLADMNVNSPVPAGDATEGGGSLAENKPLLYGAAGLIALVILLLLWMKSRRGATGTTVGTPSSGVTSFDMGSSSVDPLGTGTPTGSPSFTPAAAGGSALGGAGMAGYAAMHGTDDEDEEENETAPAPAAIPPVSPREESDTISLEEMQENPAASTPPTPARASAAAADNDMVSLNFGDEVVSESAAGENSTESESQADTATNGTAAAAAAGASSSMDADLEALLKGTFEGGSEPEIPTPADAPNLGTEGAGAAAAVEPALVFMQSFENAPEGSAPEGWRGEYDYAALTVVKLGEAGHEQALRYEKPEGSGSATYHISFPPAKGRVIAEFDIRCDEKNKFLLGIYLERDEDFKQSIHTIVHRLDPNGPASLRIQGEAAPYQMGTWSHIRYEADLNSGILDCYMDNEHVVQGIQLPVVPEYVNTLSIRDNLATTGTIYLDNIRISEA